MHGIISNVPTTRIIDAPCIACGATVGCPSVRPSVPSIDSSSGRFSVKRPVGMRYRSIGAGAGAQQQMRAASCREPRGEAQHRPVPGVAPLEWPPVGDLLSPNIPTTSTPLQQQLD